METTELLIKNQTRLRNYAAYLTMNNDEATCDLLQETNLKVLEYAHSFTPGTNFVGWVLRIMKNNFINNKRTEGKEVPLDNYERATLSCYQMQQAEVNIDRKCVDKAIARLSSDKRKALQMRIDGYDYSEIAQASGINPTTARTRVFNARLIIRKQMNY